MDSIKVPTIENAPIRQIRRVPLVTRAGVNPQALVLPRPRPGAATGEQSSFGALLHVANSPLLLHVLDSLEEAGMQHVVVGLEPEGGEDVRRVVAARGSWGFELSFIEYAPGGGLTAPLSAAAPALDGEPFVLHLCDSLSAGSLAPLLAAEGLGQFDARLLLHRASDVSSFHALTPVAELPGATLAGVGVFGPGLLEVAQGVDSSPGLERQLISALDGMRALGGHVNTRCVEHWWRFQGQRHALLEANRFLLDGLPPCEFQGQLEGGHVQGNVVIHETAVLKGAVVRGPAIIGPGARLTRAYVGPYTAIGRDVVVEGAEIEYSIVMDGARISYLGGRLESSVIGAGAEIFRDFRLPTAIRLEIGEGAEVALA
jgi:glucose-1-phosphate thymidylyltransferase